MERAVRGDAENIDDVKRTQIHANLYSRKHGKSGRMSHRGRESALAKRKDMYIASMPESDCK